MHALDWLLAGDAAPFETQELVHVTGASAITIQNWTQRGLIEPLQGNPGSGYRRQFNGVSLAVMAVAQALMDLGLPAAHAVGCSIDVVVAFGKHLKKVKLWSTAANTCVHVAAGPTGVVPTLYDIDAAATLMKRIYISAQPGIVLPVGAMLVAVAEKARALRAAEESTPEIESAGYAQPGAHAARMAAARKSKPKE